MFPGLYGGGFNFEQILMHVLVKISFNTILQITLQYNTIESNTIKKLHYDYDTLRYIKLNYSTQYNTLPSTHYVNLHDFITI